MKKKHIYVTEISHKKLRKSLYWTTAGNADILIKDLDQDHLVNILLYLKRKLKDLLEFKLPVININGKQIDTWIEILSNELEYRNKK